MLNMGKEPLLGTEETDLKFCLYEQINRDFPYVTQARKLSSVEVTCCNHLPFP